MFRCNFIGLSRPTAEYKRRTQNVTAMGSLLKYCCMKNGSVLFSPDLTQADGAKGFSIRGIWNPTPDNVGSQCGGWPGPAINNTRTHDLPPHEAGTFRLGYFRRERTRRGRMSGYGMSGSYSRRTCDTNDAFSCFWNTTTTKKSESVYNGKVFPTRVKFREDT